MLFNALPLCIGVTVLLAFATSGSAQPFNAAGGLLAPPRIQTTIPVSDRLPDFNIEGLCKATARDDAAMGLALAQPVDNCMRGYAASARRSGPTAPCMRSSVTSSAQPS